jgi:hypothetical protein
MADFPRCSLRSRRQRKAWGVSPRVQSITMFQPANAGDRTAAAHFMGWHSNLFAILGLTPQALCSRLLRRLQPGTTAFEGTPPWSAPTCRRFAPTSEVLNSGPKRRQVAALQGGA